MLARRLLVLFAVMVSAPVLYGQDLPIGQRVRVTLTDSSRYVAVADSAHDGRLWLASSPHPILLDQVTGIEVSRGKKTNWLLGAGLGAVAGAAIGFLLKSAFEQDIPSEDEGPITAAYVGAGALGGTLIGIGLSAALAPERWEAVPPDSTGTIP
jgi:hypothetical protein